MTLYIIRFSNYEPPEIDSIWCHKENAENRLNEMSDDWVIEEWQTNDDPILSKEGEE